MSPRRTHHSSSVLFTLKHSPQFNSFERLDWKATHGKDIPSHMLKTSVCGNSPENHHTAQLQTLKTKGKILNLSDDATLDNWRWFRHRALLHPSLFTRPQIQQRNFLIHFTLESGGYYLTGTQIITHTSSTSVFGKLLVNHQTINRERHS